MPTPLPSAPGDFALHLMFSGLTTLLLTLAIDAFSGGLWIGTLVAVALAFAFPLVLLGVALDNSRDRLEPFREPFREPLREPLRD